MVQTVSDSAAVVKAARILGIRGHGLPGNKAAVSSMLQIPPSPRGMVECARSEGPAGNRNAAPIETDAENSVRAQFAIMAGHGDDAVQADRLHSPALVCQVLTLDHARPKIEVVVHVFGIHAKHAAEVHAASDHGKGRVPDKVGDIVAANAQPPSGGKVKAIEIRLCFRLCQSRYGEPAKSK